ncbi:hypothetical protein ATANTOWER_028897 [Ataeniobius toweri]|uniref:Peptidase A2 domain-containing protein n=1 Tax=Ataeniobius toweri TaxID=208326 RepID=A0ABU7B368_9TELE|nr:hypothetical protein [Ataeniobius toweri]
MIRVCNKTKVQRSTPGTRRLKVRRFNILTRRTRHSGMSPVLRAEEFSVLPKLSGNYVFSLSASGQTTKEMFTKPISCVTPDEFSFKHSFLLSKLCPVNLLGRDLMCMLGMVSVSTPEGVKISAAQPQTALTAV